LFIFFLFFSAAKRFCSSLCCFNGEKAVFTGTVETVGTEEIDRVVVCDVGNKFEEDKEDDEEAKGAEIEEAAIDEEEEEEGEIGETSRSKNSCVDLDLDC